METFKECVIRPCASGFGEYECGEVGGEAWEDLDDLRNAMAQAIEEQGGELVQLGLGKLPSWAEDIRGRIHAEPLRVFAARLPGQGPGGSAEVAYYGIVGGEAE